jgi:predicted PurR-regulated permease PerM
MVATQLTLEVLTMIHTETDSRQPVAIGFAIYACTHVALFSLSGLLGLPMPELWWATAALFASWPLMQWLERRGRHQLAILVGIHACVFVSAVLGVRGRDLFCAASALV